jgi:hypothetical protein
LQRYNVGSTISNVNPLSPMFKVLNQRYNVNEMLKAQMVKVRSRVQKNAGFMRVFRYGNEGEWPTYQEFAIFMDRAGAGCVPLSYFVFLLLLNGASVHDNYVALGAGMIVFTVTAVGTFAAVLLYQVQQCRHLKQLQHVIYSREGVVNDELDNDDIAQYRRDFMEFDKDLSGTIDLGELITAMESVGRKVHLLEFMRVIGMADQDLDRTISFSEFVNLFETAKLKREMLASAKSAADLSQADAALVNGGGGGLNKPALGKSRSMSSRKNGHSLKQPRSRSHVLAGGGGGGSPAAAAAGGVEAGLYKVNTVYPSLKTPGFNP